MATPRPVFRLPPPVMICYPVGALMDIPTGDWIPGRYGQTVLNGGISNITGFVGPGNCFKTTTMRYSVLSALARMSHTVDDWFYGSYDTEVNAHEGRNKRLSQAFDAFKDRDLITEGAWQITNKAEYQGNEYFAHLKDYLKEKRSTKNGKRYATAFLDRDGVSPMMVMPQWFNDIDSLTHFATDDVQAIMDKTELGQAEGNTMFMRQGLAKARMLMELPALAQGSMDYFLFTAHIGTAIAMPSGPGAPPPRKQLGSMRQGEIIKGVTNNFFYLLHNCWLFDAAGPFLNQSTKAPFFPYEPGDEVEGDLDLQKVRLKQLRGKNGASGFSIELMVSQKEGVLPTLSEFYYLKYDQKDFGIEGTDRNYNLVLYPEVSLSRTKVRKACREDKKLQRAMEITSQLAQMYEYQRELSTTVLLSPADLKAGLEKHGYDLDMILTQTRGWNTLDDDRAPLYPFSTYDLCRAARGDYTPFWLENDHKTIKPEFAKLKEGK